MSQSTENATAMDLIYLVSCAVNELKPSPERCAAMDLEAVLRLAKRHMLTVVSAFALEKTFPLPVSWKDAKATAIRRMIIFDSERAKVLRALDEDGIWYLPLKGIVLKNCYPKAAMREMSDNDILCDGSRMAQVKKVMLQLGFKCDSFGAANHDVYFKNTMYFEMHQSLFFSVMYPALASYYADVFDRLVPDENSQFAYHMTDEDFYIHILCHMFKHYDSAGIGLRALLDIYVFNQNRGHLLDRAYISRELDKLELKTFEEDVRLLAAKTFGMQPLSAEEQEQLAFFINSNCFGQFSNLLAKRLENDDSKKAKRKYIFRRIFPDAKYLEIHYPTVYRHRILYPFCVLFRPFKGMIKNRKKVFNEYKALKEYHSKDDSALSQNTFTKE